MDEWYNVPASAAIRGKGLLKDYYKSSLPLALLKVYPGYYSSRVFISWSCFACEANVVKNTVSCLGNSRQHLLDGCGKMSTIRRCLWIG
jgi:hypothetical protein